MVWFLFFLLLQLSNCSECIRDSLRRIAFAKVLIKFKLFSSKSSELLWWENNYISIVQATVLPCPFRNVFFYPSYISVCRIFSPGVVALRLVRSNLGIFIYDIHELSGFIGDPHDRPYVRIQRVYAFLLSILFLVLSRFKTL